MRARATTRKTPWLAGCAALTLCAMQAAAQQGGAAREASSEQPQDAAARVVYFVADGIEGSKFRDMDRELAVWALEMWERSAGGALHFESGAESDALLRVFWVPPGGGQYGEMRRFEANGRIGAAVFIRPDTDALGPDIAAEAERDPLLRDAIVYLTCVHEIGHALGLEHTDDYRDIMYSFQYGGDIPGYFGRYRDQLSTRADIAKVAGISAGDRAQLHALYP